MGLIALLFAAHVARAKGGVVNRRLSADYCQAITEYLNVAYKPTIPRPDTIFIGKNSEMPAIVLPRTINGIPLTITTSEAAQNRLRYRQSLVLLNVVGWIEPDSAEFLIVTFYEFKPQHNCEMNFMRNRKTGSLALKKLSFTYPYEQKKN